MKEEWQIADGRLQNENRLAQSAICNLQSKMIFLIGYRGTGKSTVARLLADQLGWEAVDANVLLEARAGRTIHQIFADEGEAGFRNREAALLEEICRGQHQVVATGGGVVLRTDNRQRLRQAGWVIWLTAEPLTLWQRLQADVTSDDRRPTLTVGGLAEIVQLLHERRPLYDACADWTVSTEGRTPSEVVQDILHRWKLG